MSFYFSSLVFVGTLETVNLSLSSVFGQFWAIISSHIASGPFAHFSGTPVKYMLHFLTHSHCIPTVLFSRSLLSCIFLSFFHASFGIACMCVYICSFLLVIQFINFLCSCVLNAMKPINLVHCFSCLFFNSRILV